MLTCLQAGLNMQSEWQLVSHRLICIVLRTGILQVLQQRPQTGLCLVKRKHSPFLPFHSTQRWYIHRCGFAPSSPAYCDYCCCCASIQSHQPRGAPSPPSCLNPPTCCNCSCDYCSGGSTPLYILSFCGLP